MPAGWPMDQCAAFSNLVLAATFETLTPSTGVPQIMSEVSCIFCRIVRGEIPSEIVYRDELVLAFRDIAPQAPNHLLVIPIRHIPSVTEVERSDEILMGRLLTVARELAETEGLSEAGYRLVINVGRDGGQAVDHIHLHILGGRGMGWPPG